MRTTITLDEDLIKRASDLTGITERTAVIRAALKALIAQESAKRLLRLQGSEPQLTAPPRLRLTEGVE
jgi:Arc/MetJ family transcription regulator